MVLPSHSWQNTAITIVPYIIPLPLLLLLRLVLVVVRCCSSSPSSVIRINCYKGNICVPQILWSWFLNGFPLLCSPCPKTYNTGDHRRRKSNSNWETTRPINIQLCCPIHSIVLFLEERCFFSPSWTKEERLSVCINCTRHPLLLQYQKGPPSTLFIVPEYLIPFKCTFIRLSL